MHVVWVLTTVLLTCWQTVSSLVGSTELSSSSVVEEEEEMIQQFMDEDFRPWMRYYEAAQHEFFRTIDVLIPDFDYDDGALVMSLVVLAIAFTCYTAHYLLFGVCRPQILLPNRSSSVSDGDAEGEFPWSFYFDKCEVFKQCYFPTFWIHWCQILLFALKCMFWNKSLEPQIRKVLKCEHFTLSDGEVVALDWFAHPDCDETTPLIALLPGVTGGTYDFVDFILEITAKPEFALVILNRRGHRGMPLTRPHFSTSGDWEDVAEMFKHIGETRPKAKVLAMGISAGTALLSCYLGHLGKNAVPCVAVNVSSGIDTSYCIKEIPSASQRLLLSFLKSYFLEPNKDLFQRQEPDMFDLLMNTQCLQIFHGNIHRLNQHRRTLTREQYMDKINPANYYKTVTVPTLFVNSLDDSIFTESIVLKGISKVLENPNQAMVIVRKGEHVCFYENFWKPRRWSDRVALEFFREFLRNQPSSGEATAS
eukprot:TRINITY_DN10570_c0_g2_i1.p1 TRINITY_DN10570_c0_g2~~TRINITY_DN10570_c0_g2_i1.p1  ORF type:complete len:478 (+),score=111.64 TRINITY_DN10570_c0_g2_i1:36-1469(+)